MANKDVLEVVEAVRVVKSRALLDRFEVAVLDEVVESLPEIPAGKFADVAKPHKTRQGQHVLRADNLVISTVFTPNIKAPKKAEIVHVKRLARSK